MKKKLLYSSVAALCMGVVGLGLYNMSTMEIEELVLCSANEGGITIPNKSRYLFADPS